MIVIGLREDRGMTEPGIETIASCGSCGNELRVRSRFCDVCGSPVAPPWADATLLLQTGSPHQAEAFDLLRRAEAGITTHNLQSFALAITGTQLAREAARNGHRDQAIEAVRRLVTLHTRDAPLLHLVCPAESLCELLIDRGSPCDLLEVEDVLGQWRLRSPGTAPMDLWTTRIRSLLAASRGALDESARLATEYAAACESIGYRHRWDGPYPVLAARGA